MSKDDMQTYDALPEAIRVVLAQADTDWMAYPIAEDYARCGHSVDDYVTLLMASILGG